MWLPHAGCFGRCTNAINFWMAIHVEINLNIKFCSCNFFDKKITHRNNRVRFALIFVLTVTMLCQSASLASNFTFLALNLSLRKTNDNAFPGFVCLPFSLCRCNRLGRPTTDAISWSVCFIVFQCYWRAAMRNIPVPFIKQELQVKSGGDGSFGSKFTAIFVLR